MVDTGFEVMYRFIDLKNFCVVRGGLYSLMCFCSCKIYINYMAEPTKLKIIFFKDVEALLAGWLLYYYWPAFYDSIGIQCNIYYHSLEQN